MKKGILILILLILALFSVSCIYAADVNDTLAASEDTGEIELSHEIESADDNLGTSEEQKVTQTDNEEKTGETDDGSFGVLNRKIRSASSGDTVYLENNYSCEDSWTQHSGIYIDQSNLVIDGQGHTIDAKQKTQIFVINGNDVTIKNITFINAIHGSCGGAIRWSDSDNGSVSGCCFVNCSAGLDGGAIEWSHSDGGCVSGCSFVNCSAGNSGGAIDWYISANGNISDCVFINNTASEGRAIKMDSDSSASLDRNWFGNTAENYETSPNAYISGASTDSWLFLNATVNPESISIAETADIIFKLYLYNGSITDYTSLAKVDLTLNSNGKLDKNVTGLDEKVTFTPTSLGTGSVTATIGDVAYTTTLTVTTDGTTFWDLNNIINGNTNDTITLDKDYSFNPASDAAFVNGIVINRPVTIKGNGNAIDAKRQARIFYVQSANAVLENLTLKNAHSNSGGGAVCFYSTGTVTNCNFTGNTATGDGGAVYFNGKGDVTNCTFVDNKATGDYSWGGAIRMYSGTVSNCNFTGNTATGDGGAINMGSGTVSNCTFVNNSAINGNSGAIDMLSGNIANCNFADNSASRGGAVYFYSTGTVSNCNFTDNTAGDWGGAIMFYGEGTVKNCNFTNNKATADYSYGGTIYFYENSIGSVINCVFTNNQATGDGGAIYFAEGSNGNVTNCNFNNNQATGDVGGAIYFYGNGTVTSCNFTNNIASDDGGAIRIYSGTVEKCNFVNNTVSDCGGAVSVRGDCNITNCNFTNNKAFEGGAVSFNEGGAVEKCNFINNTASFRGGAIRMNSGTIEKCNFVNNSASDCGGAITMDSSTVENCNFTSNNAITGSAIEFTGSVMKPISNSIFLNNKANADVLDVTQNENNIIITFMGQNNFINAIYSYQDVTFTNVTYWGSNGITNTDDNYPSRSNKEAGQNITVMGVVNGNILNTVQTTDTDGKIVLENVGEYYITVRHDEDSYYTEAEKTISNMKFYVNVTETKTTNKTVNITAKSNIYNETMPGKLLFILPNGTQINATYGANGIWWAVHTFDAYGEYKVNATYVGLDNVTVNNATITVKIKTELSGNAITTTYNINKDLIITLKDSNGNPVSGAKLIVDLNGAKTYTTDKNGQIKVSTNGLAPKTYTAKITFNGNTNYDKSTKDVKVTVKKATPKLTAKKKTFKTSVKTKKYTITLKDNTGKAIKKAKVTLKVKGKTYKATTNSKGKAVFKIKNLKKKGTFKATITYKGNKYYNKITKKANIKVIVTFKTVSKGSKDKSTVKEIQRALKDHGYYLSYKGHYLKVDGKFQSCTERSVKEFQHDKGLKVTGKVDEKTAKKLGLI